MKQYTAANATAIDQENHLLEIFSELNLEDGFKKTFVTDSDASQLAAVRRIDFSFPCWAHRLNTLLEKALNHRQLPNTITISINAIKKIVTFFKQSFLMNQLALTLKQHVYDVLLKLDDDKDEIWLLQYEQIDFIVLGEFKLLWNTKWHQCFYLLEKKMYHLNEEEKLAVEDAILLMMGTIRAINDDFNIDERQNPQIHSESSRLENIFYLKKIQDTMLWLMKNVYAWPGR
ncbi:hypothetical protein ROZALSC1DRAFT_31063 [Rozella allomycis CSF55]|uniref:Uncharacterized protein n=1 Tax=Rozella allomycis (strain CSF55) TaxID=988480 RepID=A0A075AWG1_ROZAC|nr:hypothetical protein O9G_005205 [Rozella allomycis CSF55]RKP17095.1 hypothetical protein ROZALSC1DRAFT_31063 [Rozella allomycis CSF55]|eukprot:EPZ34635.1 hypothetical protein O9G_005205 [Rozella allomycis CSF55]